MQGNRLKQIGIESSPENWEIKRRILKNCFGQINVPRIAFSKQYVHHDTVRIRNYSYTTNRLHITSADTLHLKKTNRQRFFLR